MAERTSPPTSQNPVVKNQSPPFEDVNLFASEPLCARRWRAKAAQAIDEIVIPGRAAERRGGKGIHFPKVAS
jgi:hypothetical protein